MNDRIPNLCHTPVSPAGAAPHEDARPARSRRRIRGQSVVEFAVILPVFLAFVGLTVDVARLFQTWITLQGATRDAAEAATRMADSTTATAEARRVVCLQAQHLSGFVTPGAVEACTNPVVVLVDYQRTTTDPGANTLYPIARATVQTSMPFQTMFRYPFVSIDSPWLIGSTQTYSTIQNR